MVLLSDGPPAKFLVGRDAQDIQADREEAERIIRGTWWKVEPGQAAHARIGDADQDSRYGSTGTQALVEAMARTFNRSDVVLHAIDLQGARVQNDVYEGGRVNSNAVISGRTLKRTRSRCPCPLFCGALRAATA